MAIDIVMTVWGRENITRDSLLSLGNNTTTPFNLIIVDNGSTQEARKEYEEVADIYINLPENIGLEGAKHLGMNYVESNPFISTDNDILVPKPKGDKDWLQELIELYEANPEYKAIALRPQVLVGTGDIFGENPPEIKEFSHVAGYMRIMDTDLVRELGAWSDKRPLRGHEEYWISERIRKAGFKVGWASNIRCYHLFSGDGNWGYGSLPPEAHGHTPTSLPLDDWKYIEENFL